MAREAWNTIQTCCLGNNSKLHETSDFIHVAAYFTWIKANFLPEFPNIQIHSGERCQPSSKEPNYKIQDLCLYQAPHECTLKFILFCYPNIWNFLNWILVKEYESRKVEFNWWLNLKGWCKVFANPSSYWFVGLVLDFRKICA